MTIGREHKALDMHFFFHSNTTSIILRLRSSWFCNSVGRFVPVSLHTNVCKFVFCDKTFYGARATIPFYQ